MRGRNVLQRRTKLPLRKLTRILRAHSTDSSLRWERRRAAAGYNRYKRCRLPSSVCVCLCVCVSVSCLAVSDSFDPIDYSPPGFSVYGILQARILEWVAIPFSRESS